MMLRRAAELVAKQAPLRRQSLQNAASGLSAPAFEALGHGPVCNCQSCASGSIRHFVSSSTLSQHHRSCSCDSCTFGSRRQFVSSTTAGHAAAAMQQPEAYHVPLGHTSSDLSSTACHIGLGRRRDLTLRADLTLATTAGEQKSLGEWFRASPPAPLADPASCRGACLPSSWL